MVKQLKFLQQSWQAMPRREQWAYTWRIVASALVILAGAAFIFGLRANTVGEDGASLAMYSMGALIVMLGNLVIFSTKLRFPEQFALKLCIMVVIFCSAWVNIEENVVLPMLTANCEDDCVRVYERHIPFASTQLIYEDRDGWQLRD